MGQGVEAQLRDVHASHAHRGAAAVGLRGMHQGRDADQMGRAAAAGRASAVSDRRRTYPQINSISRENQRAGCPLERLAWMS